MSDSRGAGLSPVRAVSPEVHLFGSFFGAVDKCRCLMMETNVFVSGGAVLSAFQKVGGAVGTVDGWAPGGLDLFVDRRHLGKDGLIQWHDFLRREGYTVVGEREGIGHDSGQVYCPVVWVCLITDWV